MKKITIMFLLLFGCLLASCGNDGLTKVKYTYSSYTDFTQACTNITYNNCKDIRYYYAFPLNETNEYTITYSLTTYLDEESAALSTRNFPIVYWPRTVIQSILNYKNGDSIIITYTEYTLGAPEFEIEDLTVEETRKTVDVMYDGFPIISIDYTSSAILDFVNTNLSTVTYFKAGKI